MNKLIKALDYFLARISVLLMSVLVFAVLLQVFMRYIIGSPVTFTEELSRFLLIWLGLLAAGYAYGQRMHLALDLLVLKLQGRRRAVLNMVIHTLIGLFALAVLVFGGIQLVYLTYVLDQYSPALDISMAVIYLALPISGIAIVIYAVDFVMQEFDRFKNPDVQDVSSESKDASTQSEDIHAA